jgi:DNA polymerase III alpha subunit
MLEEKHPEKSNGGVFQPAAYTDEQDIAEECSFSFEFGELFLPRFEPPEACTPGSSWNVWPCAV